MAAGKELIVEIREKDRTYLLDAFIDENGNLVLSGYELGKLARDFFGNDDYEYWYTVAKEHTDRVLLELLKEVFAHHEGDASRQFRQWLEAKRIPYAFHNY